MAVCVMIIPTGGYGYDHDTGPVRCASVGSLGVTAGGRCRAVAHEARGIRMATCARLFGG